MSTLSLLDMPLAKIRMIGDVRGYATYVAQYTTALQGISLISPAIVTYMSTSFCPSRRYFP